jgi:hypothetical protein
MTRPTPRPRRRVTLTDAITDQEPRRHHYYPHCKRKDDYSPHTSACTPSRQPRSRRQQLCKACSSSPRHSASSPHHVPLLQWQWRQHPLPFPNDRRCQGGDPPTPRTLCLEHLLLACMRGPGCGVVDCECHGSGPGPGRRFHLLGCPRRRRTACFTQRSPAFPPPRFGHGLVKRCSRCPQNPRRNWRRFGAQDARILPPCP